MKQVSIVIPAYNAEKTIQRAISSLLNQTFRNIEIVVVNDGSNDKTELVCEEFAESDQRVKLISISNQGVSNARNVGIYASHGDYIAFVDADDYVDPEYISTFVSNIDENIDLICGGYKAVSENGNTHFTQSFDKNIISHDQLYKGIEILQEAKAFNVLWNKLFRKSIIDKANLKMDTHVSMGEDLIFILEYLSNCSGGMKLVNETSYYYVLSTNGLQANFKDNSQLRFAQLNMVEKFYRDFCYPLHGFYLEALRTFYVVLLETENKKQRVKDIIDSSVYQELKRAKTRFNKKYGIFWKILSTENVLLIATFMMLFQGIKRLQGKSYRW